MEAPAKAAAPAAKAEAPAKAAAPAAKAEAPAAAPPVAKEASADSVKAAASTLQAGVDLSHLSEAERAKLAAMQQGKGPVTGGPVTGSARALAVAGQVISRYRMYIKKRPPLFFSLYAFGSASFGRTSRNEE